MHWMDIGGITDWVKFDRDESLECGYLVTAGETYCRDCGGGGLDPETREVCEECKGEGAFK